MTKQELTELFEKYLKRGVNELDWQTHKNKNLNEFEIELSKCEEFLRSSSINEEIKIGILLTGHIRNNNILNGIINYFSSFNFDVFIHTWDTIGIKGSETNLNSTIDKDKVIQEISKIPNVKSYIIENNKEIIESMETINGYFNYSSPEVFIKSQLYSINQTFKLMEEYSINTQKKYDLVFKFRFDSSIKNFSLNRNEILDVINNDIIFVPNTDNSHSHPDYGTSCHACDTMYYTHKLKKVHIFPHTTIICDLFAFGSFKSMKDYCNLINQYDSLNQLFLSKNLDSLKINNQNIITKNGNYQLIGNKGHIDSLYYFYCSYPERLLQFHLKNYMLVQSRNIKLILVR